MNFVTFMPSKFILPSSTIQIHLPVMNLFTDDGKYHYHRVLVPFKPSNNAKVDDWAGIIINFASNSIYYIDSRPNIFDNINNQNSADIQSEFNETLNKYTTKIREWLRECRGNINLEMPENFEKLLQFDISPYPYLSISNQITSNLFDSGIYILTFFDFIYHETPIAFLSEDVSHFRDIYALACFNNDLDN